MTSVINVEIRQSAGTLPAPQTQPVVVGQIRYQSVSGSGIGQFIAEGKTSQPYPADFTSPLPSQEKPAAGLADWIVETYSELCRIAARYLKGERFGYDFEPAELVHEAFIKMVKEPCQSWQNEAHFLATGSRAIREILIEHARARLAQKREGELQPVPLDEALVLATRASG